MQNTHKTIKREGFTLLEVIIVIIIVGVLASLALPRFFNLIESSRSVEAMAMLKVWRESIERCYVMTRDYGLCRDINTLDIDNPTTSPGSHFDSASFMTNGTDYMIMVGRNTYELGIVDPGGPAGCPGFAAFVTGKSLVVLCARNSINKIFVNGSGFYQGLK